MKEQKPVDLINVGRYDYLEWVLRAILKNLYVDRFQRDDRRVEITIPGLRMSCFVRLSSELQDTHHFMLSRSVYLYGENKIRNELTEDEQMWILANEKLAREDAWQLKVRLDKEYTYTILNIAECALPMERFEIAGQGTSLGAVEILAFQYDDIIKDAKSCGCDDNVFVSQTRPFWRPFIPDPTKFVVYGPSNLYYTQKPVCTVSYSIQKKDGGIVSARDNKLSPTLVFTTLSEKHNGQDGRNIAPNRDVVVPWGPFGNPDEDTDTQIIEESLDDSRGRFALDKLYDIPLNGSSLLRKWCLPPLVISYTDKKGRVIGSEVLSVPLSFRTADDICISGRVFSAYLQLVLLQNIATVCMREKLPRSFRFNQNDLLDVYDTFCSLAHYGYLPAVHGEEYQIPCINIWLRLDGDQYVLSSSPNANGTEWVDDWYNYLVATNAPVLRAYGLVNEFNNSFQYTDAVKNKGVKRMLPVWASDGIKDGVDMSDVVALMWSAPLDNTSDLPVILFMQTMRTLVTNKSIHDGTLLNGSLLSFGTTGAEDVVVDMLKISDQKIDEDAIKFATTSIGDGTNRKTLNVAARDIDNKMFTSFNAVLPSKLVFDDKEMMLADLRLPIWSRTLSLRVDQFNSTLPLDDISIAGSSAKIYDKKGVAITSVPDRLKGLFGNLSTHNINYMKDVVKRAVEHTIQLQSDVARMFRGKDVVDVTAPLNNLKQTKQEV